MFGYVTIYRKGLADAEMERYQGYYCGLCQALGRRYGRTGPRLARRCRTTTAAPVWYKRSGLSRICPLCASAGPAR